MANICKNFIDARISDNMLKHVFFLSKAILYLFVRPSDLFRVFSFFMLLFGQIALESLHFRQKCTDMYSKCKKKYFQGYKWKQAFR